MTTTLKVSDFAQAGQFWTAFKGCETTMVTITCPDGQTFEMPGLLNICNTWYINGPVRNEWTVSTLGGPLTGVSGDTTVTLKKPAEAKAFRKAACAHKKIW